MDDPIWQIEQVVKDLGPAGMPDASVNHDHYLYGMPIVEAGNE